MRDVHHENCVPFMGATVDPPNICIVSAFCPRTLKVHLKVSPQFRFSALTIIMTSLHYALLTEIF